MPRSVIRGRSKYASRIPAYSLLAPLMNAVAAGHITLTEVLVKPLCARLPLRLPDAVHLEIYPRTLGSGTASVGLAAARTLTLAGEFSLQRVASTALTSLRPTSIFPPPGRR